MSLSWARVKLGRTVSPVDVFLFLGLILLIYAVIGVAHEWSGPYRQKTEIDLGFLSLVWYSILSLVRVSIAYILSLIFTLTYGYFAAKSRAAEPFMVPVLDILQSVPVLGFMPGLVLALVNLFPHSNLGLELAAIIMIFTGEGWNMVFSFYSSVKAVPQELHEMTSLFRLNRWEVLRRVELPYAVNGLVWNSMLSMAGGWFFLMTIESFSLGDKDFRMPGIGAYMAVAYERNNHAAIAAGIGAMFALIILVDRCLWAPLVAWCERFKFERESHGEPPHSLVLEWLRRSDLLPAFFGARSRIVSYVTKQSQVASQRFERFPTRRVWQVVRVGLVALGVGFVFLGMRGMYQLLRATSATDWLWHLRDTFFTFLRVTFAVVLGSIWTIPLGVFIGLNPKWTRRLQPVVQIVASFPGPMLFPMITFVLLKVGIGLQVGAVALMIFASQWYILFNVISGATLIPHQMLDLAQIFGVRGWSYWRAIVLPAIFPWLVNGWITAAGGAWNASIVSEFVQWGDKSLQATGIGASITHSAQVGDYPRLAGGILVMVTTVVLLNRFFWGALYRLAETRFRMEPS